MTNEMSIATLLELIREHHSFVITSHIRPDGDAIGSTLALMHVLEGMGKRAAVVFADPIPDIYRSLPGVERVCRHIPVEAFDAAILLECDSLDRCNFDLCEFEALRPEIMINVDHHASGRDFADFNWIDSQAPAVGAMIYDLALASGTLISPAIATCLYVALLTDTGSFVYSAVTASTFGMAEHLVECGASPHDIAQAVLFSNPPAKVRLLGTALSKMHIESLGPSKDNRQREAQVAWCAITLHDMERVGADVEDCEGVVTYLIGIAGVEAAVFLREVPSRTGYRLSIRSKGKLDIARVAEHFGGGGHRNASGCNIDGSLAEVTHRIVSHLRDVCARLHSGPTSERRPLPATLVA
jgi:bifunctional oligoribonuclease and PAP phosphatase NrnA